RGPQAHVEVEVALAGHDERLVVGRTGPAVRQPPSTPLGGRGGVVDVEVPTSLRSDHVGHVVLLALSQQRVTGVAQVDQETGPPTALVDDEMRSVVLPRRTDVVVDNVLRPEAVLLVDLERSVVARS